MIRRRVCAVVRLRDGFTGRLLPPGGTVCRLDGRPLRPQWKPEGYLVVTDLAPGDHTLTLLRAGYGPAELTISGGLLEETVDLRPGPGYRFPPETAELTVRLRAKKLPAGPVYAGMAGDPAVRQAQDGGGEDGRVRLFCQGPEALLPVPGRFLAAGEAGGEVALVRALRDGTAELAAPLTLAHRRGTPWVPVQPFAPADGAVRMQFCRPGTVYLCCGGVWTRTETAAGAQEFLWNLDGG